MGPWLTTPCSRRAAARRDSRRSSSGRGPQQQRIVARWIVQCVAASILAVFVALPGCSAGTKPGQPSDHDLAVAVAMVVRDHCSQWSDSKIWLKVMGCSVDRDALGDYAPHCHVTADPDPPSGVATVVTVSGLDTATDGSVRMDLRIRSRDAEPSGWFVTEHRVVTLRWLKRSWSDMSWNLMSIRPQPR